jgi:hypothetical protein
VRRASGEDCNIRPDDPARREPQGHRRPCRSSATTSQRMGDKMNNIFWIIGVIVVVLVVLGFFGLR